MKILVLGSTGMLGTYLVRYLTDISSSLDNSETLEIFSASRKGNDFYCDFSETKTIKSIINEINPNVVVNCIAITSLEYCERNPEECLQVNGYAPGYLAEICKEKNSRLIQISTDHFYQDDGPKAHKENDKTFFLNEYAKSKLIAESEITKRGRNFLILRTSIIGLTKEQRSYLDWILENINHSREAGLYFNAYTSLIHCKQLSRIILELAQNKHLSGLYNISNKNVFSKGDLYLRVAKRFGVEPIYKKEDLNSQLLKRSISCGLSPSKIESKSDLSMPSLEDLVECIFQEQQEIANKKGYERRKSLKVQKVINRMIPYAKQDISDEDIDSVTEVLKSDFLTQGNQVPLFEDVISDHVGAKYALAANSATSCLHLSCLSLGLSKGDILWTSPITYVASANCALFCGAEVDFVDIDPLTWNISVEILEEKLKKARKIKKIPKILVLVHLAGNPCDLRKVFDLSKEYGFSIIEDASHALGSKYSEEQIGSSAYSDISVFSFHPVKNITTGEGGMILTNNKEIAEKVNLYRSHGITREANKLINKNEGPWYYEQLLLGFNFRMNDIQASLGISQMNSLEKFILKRNDLAQIYMKELKGLPLTMQRVRKEDLSAWHIFVIHLKLNELKLSRLEIYNSLRNKGIGVNVHYIPVHLQPFYKNLGFNKGDFPNSENYYDGAITIPMFTKLKKKEMKLVIQALKESIK